MDYRKRKYFLAKFDYLAYNYRIETIKSCVPSVKFHTPYNHFKGKTCYDGRVTRRMDIPSNWQMLISCLEEHQEALLYELRKAQRRDDLGCAWVELTKDVCGQ